MQPSRKVEFCEDNKSCISAFCSMCWAGGGIFGQSESFLDISYFQQIDILLGEWSLAPE